MRNALVIATSERPIAELRDALGDNVGELRVVVPTVRQSRLEWLLEEGSAKASLEPSAVAR